MKRLFQAIFAFMTILTASLATSCHDPIYEMIENEVELETNGLRGDIRSIVPFKNYIYCCNNMIYRKSALASYEGGGENKQWREVSTSFTSGTIIFLASDENYIYALSVEWDADESEGENLPYRASIFYSSDGNSWSRVSIAGESSLRIDSDDRVVVFDNQVQSYGGNGSISVTGRKAYFGFYDDDTSGKNGTYSLSAGSATKTSDTTYCKAAGDKFSTYYAFAKGSSMYYWGKSSDDSIYWGSDPSSASGSLDLNSGVILSISVTSDYLLLGTTSGIERVPLDSSGNVSGGTASFKSGNNARSILTGRIFTTYVLDNSAKEGETDEYASQTIFGSISSSSISFDEVGLFAYYRNRNQWNRDGTDSSSSDGN